MNASQITERANRREREERCEYVMIGIQIARGEFDSVPADYCDAYIGAFVGWCNDKQKFKHEIKRWLSGNLGVDLKDGESMSDAIMRTGKGNAKRKELAKVIHHLALHSENWTTSDEAFTEMFLQQLTAKG